MCESRNIFNWNGSSTLKETYLRMYIYICIPAFYADVDDYIIIVLTYYRTTGNQDNCYYNLNVLYWKNPLLYNIK